MTFKKTVLKNGLRLITIPMADNPSVAVLVMVEAGSKYETKADNGLSHFLEHMVFKGTTKRPHSSDISRELDSLGAHYNAFTGQEYTGYWAKAEAKHLDKILDVVSDMYLHPLLDEKEMAKERGVIIEEIRMYKDLPQAHVQDLFMELLYGDQPAGWNIAGPEANVRSFARDAFVTYRSTHYVASATTVVVAGAIDEKEVIAMVDRAFNDVSATAKAVKLAVKESQDKPRLKVAPKETDQTHLVIGVRTFSVFDKNMPTMQALSTVLGGGMSSRLFTKMRDELGICYYIRTSHDPFTDHGFLSVSAGVDNTRVEEAVKGILAECARLKTELVPPAELQKAKDYIAGTTMLELETSEERAEYCGYQEALKGRVDSPEDLIAKVNAVTAADIQALARRIFVDAGLNLALIGRAKEENLAPIVRFG